MEQTIQQLDEHGWLTQARRCASPNFNHRPIGMEIDLLVIHAISLPPGQFGGEDIHKLFLNQLDCHTHPYYVELRGVKVSSHFLIQRDGELIQFVSTQDRAWHAGVSVFQGRENCNDFSIGVELEGSDDQPFTDLQYDQLISLSKVLQHYFPAITHQRIVGHVDIAPGRKTDPGPHFDWQRYQQGLITD